LCRFISSIWQYLGKRPDFWMVMEIDGEREACWLPKVALSQAVSRTVSAYHCSKVHQCY